MPFNNFKWYCCICDLVEQHGSICVESSCDWARSFRLPDLDLGLPTVERKARITHIILKRNPICVVLSDGTVLYFTYDEFKRIKGKPEVGSTLQVKMTRLAGDGSGFPSKVQSCEVFQ